MASGATEVWAGTAPHIAVLRRYAVDQLSPIAAFLRLRPFGAHTLLESVAGDEKIARYSFIAVGEWARLTDRAGTAVVEGAGMHLAADDPLVLLRQVSARLKVEVPRGVELPFAGGAVGYFAYDWVRQLERLPSRHPHTAPKWEWVWPTAVVAFDHKQRTLWLIVEAEAGGEDEAQRRLDAFESALSAPLRVQPPVVKRTGPVVSNLDASAYHAMVERAREYIRAGDIFQVVLGQQLSSTVDGDPFDLYRRLRRANPSPYLAYMETEARTLVLASPEALVRVEGKTVINRPIAGTRPRGRDAEEDDRLWADLIQDPKERAEHTMLVDLARNDLGRVCRYGSVGVSELMVRETYSHVIHIASEVRGELCPEEDALSALAACFPAGTLSGAPKVRAMEIIEELEPAPRGVYGGVVGYLSHDGNLDTCITIRTLEIEGNRVVVQAGGGIVADSDSDRERRESFNKAAAPLSVLEAGDEEAWL